MTTTLDQIRKRFSAHSESEEQPKPTQLIPAHSICECCSNRVPILGGIGCDVYAHMSQNKLEELMSDCPLYVHDSVERGKRPEAGHLKCGDCASFDLDAEGDGYCSAAESSIASGAVACKGYIGFKGGTPIGMDSYKNCVRYELGAKCIECPYGIPCPCLQRWKR